MKGLKHKIWICLLLLALFSFLPQDAAANRAKASDGIEITIVDDTCMVKLTGSPFSNVVQTKVFDELIKRPHVKHLIIDGRFGWTSSTPVGGRYLSQTAIQTLEIKNSNFIPVSFYAAGGNSITGTSKNNLVSYKDDGSIESAGANSFTWIPYSGSYEVTNNLTTFSSPNLTNLKEGVINGFKGEKLDLSKVTTVDNFRFSGFQQMPHIKRFYLPSVRQLGGFSHVFSDMPKLQELNLKSLEKVSNSSVFLDLKNISPTYVNLSSLTNLQIHSKKVGSVDGNAPIYAQVGEKHPNNLDLYNRDTNALFYTPPSSSTYFIEQGKAIEIFAFGEKGFSSYNPKDFKINWYIDGKLSPYTGEKVTISTEDFSIGRHIAEPVIVYKGKEDPEFLKNAKTTLHIEKKPFTAEANPQSAILGENLSQKDPHSFVKNVKLKGQVLASDQYRVELIQGGSTDIVGNQTVKARVSLNTDPSNYYIDVDVPVNIKWGNSIVFGCYDYNSSGRVAGAFTLHRIANMPYIKSSSGIGGDNNPIHSYYGSDAYYRLDRYDLSQSSSYLIDENQQGKNWLEAHGADGKQDMLKKWGISQTQMVSDGDIIRAWQVEPGKNWLYEDEEQNAYNEGKEAVYYEITSQGYRPLHFNHLTPKEKSVPIYTKKSYFDQHVHDFLDKGSHSSVNIKGFSDYPDTTTSGEKTAKIRIEETLASGKKLLYDQPVTITVEKGDLTLSVPSTLFFDPFSKSLEEQMVLRKDEKPAGLMVNDSRGSGEQGGWYVTAQVERKEQGISPYLIYRGDEGTDVSLQDVAKIFTQPKQTSAQEPLGADITENWTKKSGILLKVPSKNPLEGGRYYQETITLSLVQAP